MSFILDNRADYAASFIDLSAVIELAEKLADEEIKPDDPVALVDYWLARLLQDAWGLDMELGEDGQAYQNDATYDQVKSRLGEAIMQYSPPPIQYTVGRYALSRRSSTQLYLVKQPTARHSVAPEEPTVNIVPVYWAVNAILDQLKLLLEENKKNYEDNPDDITLFEVEGDEALDKLVDFCLTCSIRNAFEVDIDPPYYEPDSAQYLMANALYDSVGDEVDRYITQFDNLRWKKLGVPIGEIPLAYTYFRKGNSVYLVSPKDES